MHLSKASASTLNGAECMNAGLSAGMFFRVVGAGRGSLVIAHIIVGPFV